MADGSASLIPKVRTLIPKCKPIDEKLREIVDHGPADLAAVDEPLLRWCRQPLRLISA
jgi:hypothetical protein